MKAPERPRPRRLKRNKTENFLCYLYGELSVHISQSANPDVHPESREHKVTLSNYIGLRINAAWHLLPNLDSVT